MRVLVLAVGRMKKGPETDLCERYLRRAADAGRAIGLRGIEVIEIRESRAAEPKRRIIEESIALTNVIPEGAFTVLLDGRGDAVTSLTFAERLGHWRDGGRPVVVFIIGGPDGLAESLRAKAQTMLAFGAATWPHQLVRIMLLEQIYRAITILSGHPYHRD